MRGVVAKNHDTSWAGKDSPPAEGWHERSEGRGGFSQSRRVVESVL